MEGPERNKPNPFVRPGWNADGGQITPGPRRYGPDPRHNPASPSPAVDPAVLRELREAWEEFEVTKGDWAKDR